MEPSWLKKLFLFFNIISNLAFDYLFLGFKIPKGEPLVEIMSDLNEGIFAWVTVNFLLNRLEDLG
jgi:hypothetical protein